MKDLVAFLVRLVTGAQGHWFDCQPRAGQRVYIANHSSHLDFLVLWAVLPSTVRGVTRPVAAKDYWERNALRRWLALSVFRAVLVDRNPGTMVGADTALRPLADALRQGSSLILFPEGTRGTGAEVAAFKSGLYYLCRMTPGVEVVPAYLANLNRILPKGEFVMVPLLSRVSFGPPLRLEAGERKPLFLERARKAVRSLEEAR
jgi:1-acyl-sn-glycerol-3-phosphate acyltransferase